MKCKECEGKAFSATHRNVGERLAYYTVPFHVFECNGCGKHCWGFRLKPEEKFQWVGHIATPLVLLALFYVAFAFTSEDTPAAPKLAQNPGESAPQPEVVEDQVAAATINNADTSEPTSNKPVTNPQPSTNVEPFADDSPVIYEDSPEVSAFVRQQAIRNGGKPPNITLDDTKLSAEEVAMDEQPKPAEEKPTSTGKINAQPPPVDPPRRKPALESLPEAQTQAAFEVRSVRYSISDDQVFELVLETTNANIQPSAPVRLGNHRQYIDIPGNWQAANGVANRLDVRNFPLDAVRFGFGVDRLRVVFDLTEPMAELQALPNGNQLRLVLRPPK